MLTKRMKYISLIAILVLAMFTVMGCGGTKQEATGTKETQQQTDNSKYAAKVNDSYVTKEALDTAYNETLKYYETTARKLTPGEKTMLKKDTLTNLINDEILKQEVVKRKLNIDELVTKEINRLKKNNGEQAYQKMLKEHNYTEAKYEAKLWKKFLYSALKQELAKEKGLTDPFAQQQTLDKYIKDLKTKATIEIYETFK